MDNVERVDAGKLRIFREKTCLILIIFLSIIIWAFVILSFFSPNQIEELRVASEAKVGDRFEPFFTPAFILGFFLIGLFSHLLAIAYIRLNGIKVGPNQFSEIAKSIENLSARLGLKKAPDAFVINGNGVLNAFAARLVFRRIIVIYSNLAEALIELNDQKQLDAVIAHELGHHALLHTHIVDWFLSPGKLVPFLGSALSRAREYSSDRVMKTLIGDGEVCEKALVKLAAGGVLGSRVNVNAYLSQVKEERGFFAWLAETLSTHPHLPKRIAAMRKHLVDSKV